jgi:hypothetical protein
MILHLAKVPFAVPPWWLWRSPAIASVLSSSGLSQLGRRNEESAGAEALCRQIVGLPWQDMRLKLSKGVSRPLKASERAVWIREPNRGNERLAVPA